MIRNKIRHIILYPIQNKINEIIDEELGFDVYFYTDIIQWLNITNTVDINYEE